MSVGFHQERAAVLVSQPAADGWNIYAALDAAGSEQVPQIMMGDSMGSDFLQRAIKSFWAFANLEHFPVQWFAWTFGAQSFKYRPGIRNHGNPAPAFPALCPKERVTAYHDLACLKIQVPPFQRVRLTLAHPRIGQALHEISAITRETAVPIAHLPNHRVELLSARQDDLFRSKRCAF